MGPSMSFGAFPTRSVITKVTVIVMKWNRRMLKCQGAAMLQREAGSLRFKIPLIP